MFRSVLEGPLSKWSERRLQWTIFLVCLAVRAAFVLATAGTSFAPDNDWQRYDAQSDGILHGDFDLEEDLFIGAPFYPWFQAFFKLVFGASWLPAITIVVVLLSAFSGVVLYRIARHLFDRRVGVMTALIYSVFPTTLIWVNSRSQDMPFMAFLIFFVYLWLQAIDQPSVKRTVLAAVLFSCAFLTKSHILLFAPFIALYWWMASPASRASRVGQVALFAGTCFVFTLPHGLYNLKRHGIYVISSTGTGGHFLTGHNEDVYRFIVDPPPLGSPEHHRILAMDYLVMREIRDTLPTLTHKQKQQLYLSKGLAWCRANPGKLAQLTLYDLYYFLLPGVNYHHYPFKRWLILFLLSLPLYVFAYPGIVMALRRDFRRHAWILWLVVAMIIFSCGFFVQNRFRSVTLEPFYMIYAAYAALALLGRVLPRGEGVAGEMA